MHDSKMTVAWIKRFQIAGCRIPVYARKNQAFQAINEKFNQKLLQAGTVIIAGTANILSK